MKGLTHFMSGVALASFFQTAVQMGASPKTGIEGAASSFILALGGLYGIMPDTLDFKFGQFFSKPDYNIDCDPIDTNPQKMAEQLGKAIEDSYFNNRYVKAQLFPMRLGANLWRQYVIKFDGKNNEIVIIINEVVSTSQVPFLDTEPKEENKRIGKYKLKCNLLETHGRPSVVDIMSGPQYGFKRNGDYVEVEFLPWHRTWSHSYVVGFLLSLPVLIICLLLGLKKLSFLYALLAFLGFAIHITEDLTGHMGGSLIWPFSFTRSNGLSLFRASNPHANFSVDFTCVVIILFNLDRFTTKVISITPLAYFTYFLLIPLLIYFGFVYIFGTKVSKPKGGVLSAEAALASYESNIRNEELMFEYDGEIN